jgi:hypothetical protein
MARSSPVAITVRISSTPPACPTAAVADVSTRTRGYKPVLFTLKVLLEFGICGPTQSTFSQVKSTFHVTHASHSPTGMTPEVGTRTPIGMTGDRLLAQTV